MDIVDNNLKKGLTKGANTFIAENNYEKNNKIFGK